MEGEREREIEIYYEELAHTVIEVAKSPAL